MDERILNKLNQLGEQQKEQQKLISSLIKKYDNLLEDIVDTMLATECGFWACDGDYRKEPENMVTCITCQALNKIYKEFPQLFKTEENEDGYKSKRPHKKC
jgi:hypothetical protein